MNMSNEQLMASCGMDATNNSNVVENKNELLETSQLTESENQNAKYNEEDSKVIESADEVTTVSEGTDIVNTEKATDLTESEVTDSTELTDTKELEEVEVKKPIITLGENENLFAMLGMEMPIEKKKIIPAVKPASTKTTAAKASVKLDENILKEDTDKIVKVYGQEVRQMSKDEKADLEEIRLYIVDTLGFREYQKKETEFKIINDGNTQIIIPTLKFKPKG